jgi:hypothetical protein
MRDASRLAMTALALAACGAPDAARSARPPSETAPLAALLAATVCAELENRPIALASGGDGVRDTYLVVRRCRARAERATLAVAADALAWIAVDRDFGAVALHSFVHATIHGDVALRASAREVAGRLEVTLSPRRDPSVGVEPVGILDPTPQNWASFFAMELAPSAGVSPEAVAKDKLRQELERTLRDALARPLVVTYDARTGAAEAGASPARGARRLRVAPHGTALEGPFAPTRAATTIQVGTTAPVVVRALCTSHAERVLDADRRGDLIPTDDWPAPTSGAVTLPAMPCPWALAVRAAAEGVALVDLGPLPFAPAQSGRPRVPERWVSVDALTPDEPLEPDLSVVATAAEWEHELGTHDRAPPAIVVLAAGEGLRVRVVRRVRGARVVEAAASVSLDAPGDVERALTLDSPDGRTRARLHVRARVRLAEGP